MWRSVEHERKAEQVTKLKLSVDKHRLDLECVNQIDMREEVCFALVDAENRLAAAKAARDLLHAQLIQIGQHNPAQLNLSDRPTVDQLRAAVECDQEYQAADEVYRDAVTEVAMLKAADRVLDDRRRMLEHLVQLHGRAYWAEPRVSGADAQGVRDAVSSQAIGSGVVVRRRREVQ